MGSIAQKAKLRSVLRPLYWIAVPVLVFVFRLREALFGQGSLFRGYDGAIQSYPWLVKVLTGWRQFDPPFWDFATFSGTTFIGELQTGALYPVTVIWAWIAPPQGKSLEALILLHYVLAFCFMALFCRKLGFSIPATLLGSLSFATYLDWSQPNRMFGMVFLPLTLFFFLKSLQPGTRHWKSWMCAAGAALAGTLLAGHHQPFVHTVFCLALFSLLVCVGSVGVGRNLASLVGAVLTALLFCAPQILLTWRYLGEAYRWIPERVPALSQVPFQKYAFENTLDPRLLEYLLQSWIPLAACIALVALGANQRPDRRRLILFSLLLGAFSLLASLGHATPVGRLTWYVPGLNMVRETERFIFPFLFAASLLLGIATDALIGWLGRVLPSQADPSWIRRAFPKGAPLIALGCWLWVHSQLYLYVQPAGDDLSPGLLYPANPKAASSANAGAIAFLIDRFKQDQGQCRVVNFKDTLAPNLGDIYPIFSVSGHRATMQAAYFDYLEKAWGDPLSPRFDQLGACYLVSKQAFDLPVLFRSGEVTLYRRPGALSVFRLVDKVTGETGPAPLRETRWASNQVTITLAGSVRSEKLIFAQMAYPGWRVRVDGSPRALSERDGFLAVDLRPGDQVVVFSYHPVGLAWTILLAVFPVALLASDWRRRYKSASDPSEGGARGVETKSVEH